MQYFDQTSPRLCRSDTDLTRLDAGLAHALESMSNIPKPTVGPNNRQELAWLIRLSYGAMFCCGMINSIFVWGMSTTAPSNMSGNVRNFATGLTGYKWYARYTNFWSPVCFILGVIVSGIWTSEKRLRTMRVASKCMVACGITVWVLAAIVGQGAWPEQREVLYVACWVMGLQGGMMKATSGYCDTTGVSGTLTDCGLIVGQATKLENRSRSAAWKLFSLLVLWVAFLTGSFSGAAVCYCWGYRSEKLVVGIRDDGDWAVACALMVAGAVFVLLGIAGYFVAILIIGDSGEGMHRQNSSQTTSIMLFTRELRELQTLAARMEKEKSECSKHNLIPEGRLQVLQDPVADILKEVDERKDGLVRTALLAAFLTGATNYIAADVIGGSRQASVSHITGPHIKFAIGLADLVTGNHSIQMKGEQASVCVVPGILTWVFWVAGTILSGVITRNQSDRNYKTGVLILAVVGSWIIFVGALGAFGPKWLHESPAPYSYMVHVLSFSFGLLNGTMTSTTGFARIGHMTGVQMNIGLLFGQLCNPENDNPDVRWKLRQSAGLVACWASGSASQCLLRKYVAICPWVQVMFIGAAFVAAGLTRLNLRRSRIRRLMALTERRTMFPQSRDRADRGNSVESFASVDSLALAQLQHLGTAGGWCEDQSAYPSTYPAPELDIRDSIGRRASIDGTDPLDHPANAATLQMSTRSPRATSLRSPRSPRSPKPARSSNREESFRATISASLWY